MSFTLTDMNRLLPILLTRSSRLLRIRNRQKKKNNERIAAERICRHILYSRKKPMLLHRLLSLFSVCLTFHVLYDNVIDFS